jgi:hypothetical protein
MNGKICDVWELGVCKDPLQRSRLILEKSRNENPQFENANLAFSNFAWRSLQAKA